MLAMATASSTSPPGLPRMSSTTPVAPCSMASLERVTDALGGAVGELDQPDVGDPGPRHEGPGDWRDLDLGPHDGNLAGAAIAMTDAQRDRGARLTAHQADDLVHGQPLGRLRRRRW